MNRWFAVLNPWNKINIGIDLCVFFEKVKSVGIDMWIKYSSRVSIYHDTKIYITLI